MGFIFDSGGNANIEGEDGRLENLTDSTTEGLSVSKAESKLPGTFEKNRGGRLQRPPRCVWNLSCNSHKSKTIQNGQCSLSGGERVDVLSRRTFVKGAEEFSLSGRRSCHGKFRSNVAWQEEGGWRSFPFLLPDALCEFPGNDSSSLPARVPLCCLTCHTAI